MGKSTEIIQGKFRSLKRIFGIEESRIKKKLTLYFILISVVSISISAEIILEVSETPFRTKLAKSFVAEISRHMPIPEDFSIEQINLKNAFSDLNQLSMRMMLLFIVIVITIVTAFSLFSKDIATPIGSLVDGAKKVADGDLTYALEIHSLDEIGQLAKLINDMNANLQELVVEIRFEMNRMSKAVEQMETSLDDSLQEDFLEAIREKKTIKMSQIISLQRSGTEVKNHLRNLKDDLAALSMLIDMYKVYQVHSTNQDQEV